MKHLRNNTGIEPGNPVVTAIADAEAQWDRYLGTNSGLRGRQIVQIITYCGMLDDILQDLLVISFEHDDEDAEVKRLFSYYEDGFLTGPVNKARLAYAMGLVDRETLRDVKELFGIRNKLTHETRADLMHKEILQACEKLSKQSKPPSDEDAVWRVFSAAVERCCRSLATSVSRVRHRRLPRERADGTTDSPA